MSSLNEPRRRSIGLTVTDSYSRKEYNAMIDVALGGRAAEEMIFGRDDVTSGCSSDLQRATDVATRMIRVSTSGTLLRDEC